MQRKIAYRKIVALFHFQFYNRVWVLPPHFLLASYAKQVVASHFFSLSSIELLPHSRLCAFFRFQSNFMAVIFPIGIGWSKYYSISLAE